MFHLRQTIASTYRKLKTVLYNNISCPIDANFRLA